VRFTTGFICILGFLESAGIFIQEFTGLEDMRFSEQVLESHGIRPEPVPEILDIGQFQK
jgi:hypothetical protein